jgi:YggT family protein
MSWIPGLRNNGFGRIIYGLTEPILGPIRHMLDNSPIGGGMMLDFSPIIALFIMKIISMILQAVITAIF